MAGREGPTLRAQWLGQQLRLLREQAGLTLKQTADYLERDPSTVSRFESAEYPIRRADLVALLDLYMVSDRRRRDGLIELREGVWQKGWWDGFAAEVDRRFIDYIWLESRAGEIRTFDDTLLPGLVQTRDYARAAIEAAENDGALDLIERGVELRMARQNVITGEGNTRLVSIIDEAVLRRRVGGPVVAQSQLRHLQTLAALPNVEIRVLPFSVGAHASPAGAFKIFLLPDPYPDVAYTETLAGSIYVEAPDVERFERAYDRLQSLAMPPDESTTFISTMLKDAE